MKIAIAGATGFVGTRLVESLQSQGHQVIILTRNPGRATARFKQVEAIEFSTNSDDGALTAAIDGCDAVVNLAGEPIADKRWNAERKQVLLDSRKQTTERLVSAIDRSTHKPQVLVNASAIGYYGTSLTAEFDENSPVGNDFLAQLCQTWETTAAKVVEGGTRSVIIRLGIVMGNGGVLGKMLTPFKSFTGGPIGSGQQWVAWIHIDDLVRLLITAITSPDMQGIYNGTAPNPVRMQELASTLGTVLARPSWLPVPGLAIQALLGEGAILVLEGQKVLPQRALDRGFTFEYPDLQSALANILG
jgi:uncharacterized protein